MKKSRLLKLTSYVTIIVLLLTLVFPTGLSLYAEDDLTSTVTMEESATVAAAENQAPAAAPEEILQAEAIQDQLQAEALKDILQTDVLKDDVPTVTGEEPNQETDPEETEPETDKDDENAKKDESKDKAPLLRASGEQTENSVAKIGDTYYDSLAEAVAAASAGDTIVMVKDSAESTDYIPVRKNLTIDFAGFTISGTSNYGLLSVEGGAHLVIVDSAGGGMLLGMSNAFPGEGVLDIESNASAELRGGTIKSNGDHVVEVGDGSTFTMTGGTVTAYAKGFQGTQWAIYGFSDSHIIVSGGTVDKGNANYAFGYSDLTITGSAYVRGPMRVTPSAFDGVNLTITGGTIEGMVDIPRGAATISGGFINSPDIGVRADTLQEGWEPHGITITDGAIIKGATASIKNMGWPSDQVVINGGLFGDASGNEPNITRAGNRYLLEITEGPNAGYYALSEVDPVALVDTLPCVTLADAVAAASSGSHTIKMLQNVEENITIPAGANITLDLNGRTVSASDNGDATVQNNGIFTLKDSASGGKLVSANGAAIAAGADSTTTISSGVIESAQGAVVAGENTGASITISGGTLKASESASIDAGSGNVININGGVLLALSNAAVTSGGNNTITVSNGVLESTLCTSDGDSLSVTGGSINGTGVPGILVNGGEVSISAGTIYSADEAGILARGGITTISGGEITTTGTGSAIVFEIPSGGSDLPDNAGITVTNGTFISDADSVAYAGEGAQDRIHLSGGAYSDDSGSAVDIPEGYAFNLREDDLYHLVQAVAAIERGGVTLIYPSVYAAFDDARSGETVKLIADENPAQDRPYVSDKNITFDLNSHSFISANGILVDYDGVLKVVDTGDGGLIKSTDGDGITARNGSNVTIESGTIEGSDIAVYLYFDHSNGTSLTVNGGTLNGERFGISVLGSDASHPEYSCNVTIKGGTITGRETGIRISSGAMVTIEDGIIQGQRSSIRVPGSQAAENFEINGGHYSDGAGNGANITRKDGLMLALGADENYPELWSLEAVAQNNRTEKAYGSIKTAFEEAGNGDTITVLKDHELNETVEAANNITLDLAGYTLTSILSGDEANTLSVADGGKLTLTDSSASSGALGTGTIASTGCTAVYVADGGEFVMETGTVNGGAFGINNRGTATVEDGIVTASDTGKSVQNLGEAFHINGGHFSDEEGNDNDFTRKEGLRLALGDDTAYPELWSLSVAVENTMTGKKYSNITDAFADAANGQTITVLKDHELIDIARAENDITLDLAGHTVTSNLTRGTANTVSVSNGGKLTLTDSVGSGKIVNAAEGLGSGIHVASGGEFVMESGNIESERFGVWIQGKAAINGGAITADGTAVNAANGSDVTINSGFVSGSGSVANAGTASFKINGGYFNDDAGNGDAFTRPEGEKLFKGADPAYPELYVLAKPVAKIGETIYPSLSAAVAAANAGEGGETIEIIADFTENNSNTITITKDVTIDLAGHKVTSNYNNTFLRVENNAALLVKDSAEGGLLENSYPAGALIVDQGSAEIQSGTIKGGGRTVTVHGEGSLTVNGGTVTGRRDLSSGYKCVIWSWADSTVTITGDGVVDGSNVDNGIVAEGTVVIAENAGVTGSSVGVRTVNSTASVEVTGGAVTASGNGIYAPSGTVTVSDGIITATNGESVYKGETASFTINGGVYSDDAGNANGFVRLDDKILFKGADSSYPEMYALSDVVAQNIDTGVGYNDVRTAFNEVVAGQTIQLLTNVSSEEAVSVSKEMTFDLNGKKLTLNTELTVSAPLTIIDSSATPEDPVGTGAIENTTGTAVRSRGGNGALNVQAGTITGATYGIESAAQAVVNGGRVHGGTYGIYNQSKTTVNGGTITGGTAAAYSNRDTITINGGYFGELGGSASSLGVTADNGRIEINGGAFSDDVGNSGDPYILPEGASLVQGEDDWWKLNQMVAKRELYYDGSYHYVYYDTIAEAIAAVTPGSQSVSDWVYVIADTTESFEFTRDDRVTVILQGHTLTVNEDEGIKATGQGSLVIGRGTIQAGTTTEGQTAQNIIAAAGGSIGVSEATVRSTAPVFYAYNGGTIEAGGSNVSSGTSGPTATAEGSRSRFRLTWSSSAESVLTGPSDGSPAVLIKEGARFEGDGRIVATAGNALLVDGEGSSAYLRGTVVKSSSDEAAVVSQNGALIGMENGSRTEIEATQADAVVARTGGTVTITDGGYIKAPADQYAVLAHEGGTATIAGFEITGDVSAGSEAGPGTVTVKDGAKILGEIHKIGDESVFDIQGGAFQTDTGNGDEFIRPEGYRLVQDEEGDDLYRLKQYVAWNMQTGKYYYDINKAKDEAASDGSETIQLLADIDMGWGSEGYGDGGMLYLANSLTLDLNGHTITGRDRSGAVWVAYYSDAYAGKVKIIDSSEEKTGKIINPGFGAAIKCDPNTELTINGGNIVANANSVVPAQAVVAYGKLTINGGNFESSGYQTVFVSNNEVGAGEVIINGGTFKGGDYIIAGWGESSVTINGGDFGDPANPPANATVDGNIAINDGRFADDKGNGEQFARRDNLLLQVTDGGWFMLGEPVAKRTVEGKDIYYASIQFALNAATEDDTVYLLQDTTEHFSTDKKATLDLGEHKLTVDADEGVQATGGMLTIKNGTIESGKTDEDADASGIISAAEGVIILGEDLTVTAADTAIKVTNGGQVEILGAEVTGTSDNPVATVSGQPSSLHLTDGSITAASGVSVEDGGGFYQSGGTLSISSGSAVMVSGEDSIGYIAGGTWSTGSDSATAYAAESGSLLVQGGTVINTTDGVALAAENGGSVRVIDGVIDGDVQMTGDTSEFSIEGGAFKTDTGNGDTFTREGDQILILGADPEHPDYYALGDAVVHNTTKDEYYTSLEAALADSADGDTLKLLKNVDLGDEEAIVENTITLDLNGKTVSGTMTPILVDEGANLTISGGKLTGGRDGIENKGTLTVVEDMSISGNRHGINNNGGTATVNGEYVTGVNASGIYNTAGATLELNGGQVMGSTFGIYNGNGSKVTVNDGVIYAIGDGGNSVWNTGSTSTFIINGGHYSDGAGNGDEFTRRDDLVLIRGIDDHYLLMWSLNAVAQNTRTGKKYASLKEAFEETDNGDTVVVLLDHKLDEVADVTTEITLDLAGYTVTSDLLKGTANTIAVREGGILTLTDRSEEGTGKISNTQATVGSGVYVGANGEFIMEGGTIESADAGVWSQGKATINGGTITADRHGVNTAGGEVTINGGKIGGTNSVNIGNPATFNINGGLFSDDTGNGDGFTRPEDYTLTDEDGDGWYELTTHIAKRIVDGEEVFYGTLQKALDDAVEGDTVWVIKDITLDKTAVLRGKSITLDIANHTITNADSSDTAEGLIKITDETAGGDFNNASLTLTGSAEGKLVAANGDAIRVEGANSEGESQAAFVMDTVTVEAAQAPVRAENGNVTINSGTLTGGTYGIYSALSETGQSVTVNGGAISGETASIYAEAPELFQINGGAFSDDAGNAEGFVRADDKMLVKGADSSYPEMFALADAVASIEHDGKVQYYNSIESAHDAVEEGETITVLKDISFGEAGGFISSKTYTLDLNGHELSGTGATDDVYHSVSGVIILTGGTLTVKDSSEEGTGKIHNVYGSGWRSAVVLGYNRNTVTGLVLESGTIDSEKGAGISLFAGGTATIEGGTVHSGNHNAIDNAGKLTVRGDDTVIWGGLHAIDTNGVWPGTTNIEGGKLTSAWSDDSAAVNIRSGQATISGGEIEGPTGVRNDGGTITFPEDSTASVKGTTHDSLAKGGGTTNINGGKFSDDVGNGDGYNRPAGKYLDDPDGDGWYELMAVDKTALEQAIEDAKAAEEDNAVSEDGKDRVDGTTYTTADEKQALDDAIAAAEEVLNDPEAKQSEVDAATQAIKDATETYNEAVKTASVDKSGLAEAIAAAEEAEDGNDVSEDGKDLPNGTKYTTEAEKKALDDAIAAAEEVLADPQATQNMVDAATQAIEEATDTYNDAVKTAAVDKTYLEALIDLVPDPDDVSVSEDGSDVTEGEKWATEADKTAYTEALENAQAVLADPNATQNQVDDATSALNEAAGKIQTAGINKTALQDAVDNAILPSDIAESEDGSDVSDGDYWATPEDKEAYVDALAEAARVLHDPSSQQEVDNALAVLEEAAEKIRTAEVDRDALEQAIEDATDDMDSTKISADGKDLPEGTEYVDPAEKTTLTAAIQAAQAVADDPDATQNEVEAAKEAVKAAKQAFDDAKKTVEVDRDELEEAIDAAEDAEDNNEVSEDGKDLVPGTTYTTREAKEALDDAIEAAKEVLNDPDATQNEVDEATKAIEDATDAYNDAVQTVDEADKSALEEAIEAAEAAEVPNAVSKDGTDLEPGTPYTTPAEKTALDDAIEAAKEVLNDPDATQNEVDEATKAIEDATLAYNNAVKIAAEPVVTITYVLNGGTLNGASGTVQFTCNKGTSVTLPEPERSGYTFKYWEGSIYYAGDVYIANEDHTFTAIWEKNADSGSKGDGSSGSKNAKTGDENNTALWILLMLLSGAAIAGGIGTSVLKKKRTKKQ